MDRVYMLSLVQSFQLGQISRRAFLRRSTAALGSAALANTVLTACANVPAGAPGPGPVPMAEREPEPVTATAVVTHDGTEVEVVGQSVEYPDQAEDEGLAGYLAHPGVDGTFPGVIVIQEWWGLDDHVKDVTRRIAAEGYLALAPDLYKGSVATEPDEARRLVMELDTEEAVSEIQSAIAYLVSHQRVSGDEVGIVGFCLGGRLVLMTALAEQRLGAAVAFYGQPLSAEQVVQIGAPLMGHYGSADSGIPVEGVEAMDTALDGTDIPHEFYIYEDAPHSFFNDTRDSYRPEAAQEAWARTLDWFSSYLG